MMGIVVTGVGIVSALGIGADSNLAAICKGESGISASPKLLKTANRFPVGELQLSNEELHDILGISRREHLSRTALLGILAVREAMACANIDSSKRIGLVSSTSVGGMDLTEHFFEKFIEDDSAGRLRDVVMHDCAASTDAIARHCSINGYRTTISTACSSAANAIGIFPSESTSTDEIVKLTSEVETTGADAPATNETAFAKGLYDIVFQTW